MPKICHGEPADFNAAELDDFQALVRAGGEVTADRLPQRVANAVCLSFARDDMCLLAVAGLKRPETSYRRRVETGSKTKVPADAYPYELGWVYVMPSARGRKLSFPLCEPLVAAAEGHGIFATSRVDNIGMHKTLEKLRFEQQGATWTSKQSDSNLKLYLRPAV